MTCPKWAQIYTGFLLYAYVGMHKGEYWSLTITKAAVLKLGPGVYLLMI